MGDLVINSQAEISVGNAVPFSLVGQQIEFKGEVWTVVIPYPGKTTSVYCKNAQGRYRTFILWDDVLEVES